MGRPREFDETAALDAATECFWTRGYEATSVRDLAERMGITGASLYNAFGDKRALYRRVLERYASQALAGCASVLTGELPPREAIETFFNLLVEEAVGDIRRKGCLVVNAGLEIAPSDPEFQAAVEQVFERIENFFLQCVAAGQADGTITSAQPPADIARLLLGSMLGLRVLARTRPERALLEGMARSLMAVL
jgi:TetR/AcrR family transcriptional regulator, transcriptional repressor for nem operon